MSCKTSPSAVVFALKQMEDPFRGEPDPFDVTVTAGPFALRSDSWVGPARLRMAGEEGHVELSITDSAWITHGAQACVDVFERWLNSMPCTEHRVSLILELAKPGPFSIVLSSETGPYVTPPRLTTVAA